jgi:hypothetical protein
MGHSGHAYLHMYAYYIRSFWESKFFQHDCEMCFKIYERHAQNLKSCRNVKFKKYDSWLRGSFASEKAIVARWSKFLESANCVIYVHMRLLCKL